MSTRRPARIANQQSRDRVGVVTVSTQATVYQKIAEELGVRESQVRAAVGLLDEGATVPFIARYRKEATGTLDDAQLRTLEERLRYLRELDERRVAILESIRDQGKLTEELEGQIMAAETKARLEDIYLPYKPKRRTKAQIAREAGLEPLALGLLRDPGQDPEAAAQPFVNDAVPDASAALDGARSILVEMYAEDADLIGELRERLWSRGRLVSKVRPGAEATGAKFSDYFDFSEPLAAVPSHRALAMFRGEKEEILDLTVDPAPDEEEPAAGPTDYEIAIAAKFGIVNRGRPADRWLADTVRWAWRTRIVVNLSLDVRMRVRQSAEEDAIQVFAGNLRDLLLAAPAGSRPTMGLDPAYRTGVKVAVVDATGKVVATAAVYPHKPQGQWDEALAVLAKLVREHSVELIAIGNGTASRETDQLAAELVKLMPDRSLTKIMVSEAGASVYSASPFASRELPDLDVSIRGAVSIARRLQDPLAELVKIEPKSIGVGQYQHDLAETALSRSLDAVVEDCVNAVGVDLNTASSPLLSRVSGISTGLAENIVAHRESNGPFRARTALKSVPRLGSKAFEQCAGFLRIRGGDEPLDASSVHPESYPLARRIAKAAGGDVKSLLGNGNALRGLKPSQFVDGSVGLPTITDVLKELEKPGRDPRPSFKTATFTDGIEKVEDLAPGMRLEGVVTNVAAFGAFVDVGVHQDGLVHISAMSREYVTDPREVVKPGDVVTVKVLDVDVPRKRISLTLRLDDEVPSTEAPGRSPGGKGDSRPGTSAGKNRGRGRPQPKPAQGGPAAPQGAIADALRRAGYHNTGD
ncbi:RNA-binding transcriptional accessory protein [Phytoactinopolyspora alkaliphila]|uniref:RNA-binding transcriptional accessory protein n=1 Tax=Phytoactinopolyspora alkaliphila TaxID=1783498 RepID=A0A6N9YLU3_9ACTN|nr:Tex family protein [Phytoactinopolyspora alkaliphila]NED95963.1 RNA-binding transcriptional accessory protein [Phytoactinopolyspora alkaliphila]